MKDCARADVERRMAGTKPANARRLARFMTMPPSPPGEIVRPSLSRGLAPRRVRLSRRPADREERDPAEAGNDLALLSGADAGEDARLEREALGSGKELRVPFEDEVDLF